MSLFLFCLLYRARASVTASPQSELGVLEGTVNLMGIPETTVSSHRLAGFSLSTPASLESRNLGGVFSAPLYFDMNHSYEVKEDNHCRANKPNVRL